MFMAGCVVLVMSSCHDKDTDGLWCIGLCQGVITKTSQNVITERMTLNDSCHKHAYFIFITCHDYEGVMLVLRTPLQVMCYHIYTVYI